MQRVAQMANRSRGKSRLFAEIMLDVIGRDFANVASDGQCPNGVGNVVTFNGPNGDPVAGVLDETPPRKLIANVGDPSLGPEDSASGGPKIRFVAVGESSITIK